MQIAILPHALSALPRSPVQLMQRSPITGTPNGGDPCSCFALPGYPHGPLHGEIPERNRIRLSTGYRKHCPARGGAGRAQRGRVGCRRGTRVPTSGEKPSRSPPRGDTPRSTAQGDPGVEPGPGSHSPPPGNQREDRSRGTAHHRLYARAETHGDVVSRGDTKTMKRRQGQHSPDFASPRAFARRPRSRCHVISDIRSCLVMTPCTFPCSITMTAWL